jgi:Na+/proline symporter
MNLQQIVLASYFLLMLLIGAFFARKHTGSESYFLADRKLGKHHTASTTFSTFLGAGFAFIMASFGYIYGVSIFLVVLSFLAGFIFFLKSSKHIKEKSRDQESITLPQLLNKEWDVRTQRLSSIIIIVIFCASLAVNFLIAGEILESVYGVQKIFGIAVFGVLVISYTLMGGFKGVAWTDLLQLIIIFTGVAALLALGLFKSQAVLNGLPPGHLSLTNMPLKILVGYLVAGFFLFFGSQDLFQRVFASENEETTHAGLSRFGILISALIIMSLMLGIIARGLYPGIDPDKAIPVLTNSLAGPSISAIILAAFLSMANSSADSQLLTITSNLREDFSILENIEEMKANRIIVTLVGVFCLLIALLLPSLVDLASAIASWFAILGIVVAASILWDRTTEEASFYALLTGFTAAILSTALTGNFQLATITGVIPAAIVIAVLSKFR